MPGSIALVNAVSSLLTDGQKSWFSIWHRN